MKIRDAEAIARLYRAVHFRARLDANDQNPTRCSCGKSTRVCGQRYIARLERGRQRGQTPGELIPT